MKILIFCALYEEARPIVKLLKLKHLPFHTKEFHGNFNAHAITVIVTGMGRKNTQKTCEYYLTASLPDMVFSCGYAGGLSPSLKIGDIFLSEKILIWEKGPWDHRPKEIFLKDSWKKWEGSLNQIFSQLHTGTSLTVSKAVALASEKEKMGKAFHAFSVDMEAGFIAEALAKYKTPFFNLRVISDDVKQDIKIDFSTWVTQEGKIAWKFVLMEILKHPWHVFYLLRMGYSSHQSAMRLAHCVKHFLNVLKE